MERPILVPATLLFCCLCATAPARLITASGDESNILSVHAKGAPAMAFTIKTDAFQPGGEIPAKYTCTGADVSPHLTWTDVPAEAQTLALIVDDPDAPGGAFTHWVLYNINSRSRDLAENVPKTEQPAGGAVQGRNDFRRIGYGGPCPPPGKPHRYYFKLYALDIQLSLKPGATKRELEDAMQGHVLAETDVMGKYKR